MWRQVYQQPFTVFRLSFMDGWWFERVNTITQSTENQKHKIRNQRQI